MTETLREKLPLQKNRHANLSCPQQTDKTPSLPIPQKCFAYLPSSFPFPFVIYRLGDIFGA